LDDDLEKLQAKIKSLEIKLNSSTKKHQNIDILNSDRLDSQYQKYTDITHDNKQLTNSNMNNEHNAINHQVELEQA